MGSRSVPSRLRSTFVAWSLLLSSVTVARADGLVVQQIGDLRGPIAEAVAAEAATADVTIVPFSPRLDARTTPIVLATGKAFVRQRVGNRVGGLRRAERRAIRQAYDAGQVILLLDASTHDVEALHVLLDDGAPFQSTTDPVVLAYALRQEQGVPRARLVTRPSVDDDLDDDDLDDDLDDDDLDEDDLALSRALEIVVEELTRPPAAPEDPPAAGDSPDWGSTPVQKTVLTSTANGIYNTPAEVYALHSCAENMDYYLVNTGGDWTATQATYESSDQISVDNDGNLHIDWTVGDPHCAAGGTRTSTQASAGT
jgi:hypothetical protein